MADKKSRFLKPIWYKISGRADQEKHTKTIEEVSAAYDTIIRFKRAYIQCYKQAIGQLIALIEQKKSSLKALDGEVENLEQLKEDAFAKVEIIAAELREAGVADEEIEQHQSYKRCITSFNDFKSTIVKKNVRIDKLQQDIDRLQNDIEHYKNSITMLHRDLDKTKTEQSEAVADFIAVREQEEINNMLSGVSSEETTEQLKRIREIRKRELEKL